MINIDKVLENLSNEMHDMLHKVYPPPQTDFGECVHESDGYQYNDEGDKIPLYRCINCGEYYTK